VEAITAAASMIADGLDAWALACWMAGSLFLLIQLARSIVAIRRRRRSWKAQVVDGRPVLVSNDAGPAVVGVRDLRIVLPQWALGLEPQIRAVILSHEDEHRRARDPLLLLGALAGKALVPWNVGVWWQCRRLRLAIETDCDARVLRREQDVQHYGSVLVAIAERRGPRAPAIAAALTESMSNLERRITIMTTPTPRYARTTAAVLATLASGVIALAAATPVPPGFAAVQPPRPTVALVKPPHAAEVIRPGAPTPAQAATRSLTRAVTSEAVGPVANVVIRGTVRSTTGTPLGNVTAAAVATTTKETRTAKTGPDGRYAIVFPAGDGYAVRFSRSGFLTRQLELRGRDTNFVADAVLVSVNSADENGLAIIRMQYGDSNAMIKALKLKLDSEAVGTDVGKPAIEPGERGSPPNAAGVATQPRPRTNAIIRGTVTRRDSQPIANVVVAAFSTRDGSSRTARTDPNGRYTISFTGDDTGYVMSFTARGFISQRITVKRTPTNVLTVNAVLDSMGAIPGAPGASPRTAASSPTPQPSPFFDFQVELQAREAPGNTQPEYPPTLRAANMEGRVVAQFVVDTAGHAEMGSFKVLATTHQLFSDAVKQQLPSMVFIPATIGGRKVKQLLQMPFTFTIK
jgi:outer membrane biosynthesis protein TonB